MPFQKGNKLGAKGRPKGSKNKATDVAKVQLQEILFDLDRFKADFNSISPEKRLDISMKAMGFFYSRPIVEIEVENTDYLNVEYVTAIGEEVTDEQKKQMYLKHGQKGEMPLRLDEEFE